MSISGVAIIVLACTGVIVMVLSSLNTNKAVKETSETTHRVLKINEINDLKETEKELRKLIKVKQQELENLVHAVDQAKRRTVTDLTVEQEEAIDLYERNGIKLPIDIIEELSYSNNTTYHSAVAFIEMQRKVWKAQFQVTMTKGMIG